VPVIFAAVPVAALLAWLAMKAGGPRRAARAPMTVGGGLEGGDTGRLGTGREQEEEKWRREELPFERPSATGGEVGGPYGPESNAEPPSAITSYEAPPGPTQTTLIGPSPQPPPPSDIQYSHIQEARAAFAQPPPVYHAPPRTYAPVYHAPPVSVPTPVYHGGMLPRPAPAPTPAPAPRYGGVIRAE
jgi:hypothetical protein